MSRCDLMVGLYVFMIVVMVGNFMWVVVVLGLMLVVVSLLIG